METRVLYLCVDETVRLKYLPSIFMHFEHSEYNQLTLNILSANQVTKMAAVVSSS